jgi:pyroglutamyl-peptidase
MATPRSSVIYVTGFGKFGGVDVNPTTELISKLRLSGTTQDLGVIPIDPLVVDVGNCNRCLSELPLCCDRDVIVHLGVNARAEKVNIERCAYNNMTFRIPDESGYQPDSICIEESISLDSPLETDIDVDAVVNKLRGEGFPVDVSLDPGRFICNYIYYKSLQRFDQDGLPKKTIFVHVPTTETLDIDTQFVIIQRLLEILRSQI